MRGPLLCMQFEAREVNDVWRCVRMSEHFIHEFIFGAREQRGERCGAAKSNR